MKYKFIKTVMLLALAALILSGCPGNPILGGSHDPSFALLAVNKSFTFDYIEPKRLQVVIVADPTASMIQTQEALKEYFPSFTQKLINTGIQFEIFCSHTSYEGKTPIAHIQSLDIYSNTQLQNFISQCINVEITETNIGDERGLEAAKLTWKYIITTQKLDPKAVKLTMIVTNEDDCSRDLNKHIVNPEEPFCKDQNVTRSPFDGKAYPMTDRAYADDSRLFSYTRYSDFFQKYLQSNSSHDKLSEDSKKGHIFAPVIMKPPAANGKEGVISAEQCAKDKTQKSIKNKVMSYGMRYFQVANVLGDQTYSLCEDITEVLSNINTDIQSQVQVTQFILKRKPKNPEDLEIEVTRKILDVKISTRILRDMEERNSLLDPENQWTKTSEETSTVDLQEITQQTWIRTLKYDQDFTYQKETNEIFLNPQWYTLHNDQLHIKSYIPAAFDAQVDYEAQHEGPGKE